MFAACLSFVITLGFGSVILGVPINPLQVNYPLLLLALISGFVAIVALGIALAGLTLMLKRGAWQMPDAMAGALYLLAGTTFPIAILPGWVEKSALLMPLTYWLELMRRALLGDAIARAFPIASTPEVIGLLMLTAALAIVLCLVIFRVSDHIAHERGQIDRPTGDYGYVCYPIATHLTPDAVPSSRPTVGIWAAMRRAFSASAASIRA
jgi:ABC-2 type transport system permease protein